MIEALIVLIFIVGLGVFSAFHCLSVDNEAGSIFCLTITAVALLLHTAAYL